MILTFEIFGNARNHGKKFLKLCQTSFSGSSIAGQTSAIQETKQLMSLLADVSDKLNGQQSVDSETLVHEKFNV